MKIGRCAGVIYNPLRYAGEYQDSQTGFYYLRARYYDPATAQFLTRDPLVAATEQAYTYANGSPLNYTDPRGLFVDTLLDAAFITMDVADVGCNGLNWENGLSLGADILGALLPGITGLGLGVHVAARIAKVVRRYGGKVVEGGIEFSTHRAAKQAASEIAGNLGPSPRTIRMKEFKGRPWQFEDSEKVIGKESLDGNRRWRDDFRGHKYRYGTVVGPHINVETPDIPNLHIFY